MTDVVSAAAAGITAKIAGLSAGAVLAAIVVMCLTIPRSPAEWAVALICTVMSSISGGAYLAVYLGMAALDGTFYGMTSVIGLAFVAGLPAWLLVRMGFAWLSRDGVSLIELIRELRKLRQGGRDGDE